MNREIKFRGKANCTIDRLEEIGLVHDNGWIYGTYLDGYIVNGVVESTDEYIALEEWCPVKIETVGQYTGFKDKNGKEIYEGSIIRVSCTYNSDVGEFFITNIADDLCWNNGFSAEPIRGYSCITHIAEKDLSNVEIIGNIHENPELLEVENE